MKRKLKHLSPIQRALVLMILAVALLNVFLQLEGLRYVMWGLIIVLVALHLFTVPCPHCGKYLRNGTEVCPKCGERQLEESEESND